MPAGELGAGVNEAAYKAPVLTVLGTVGEMTFTTDKHYGDSDGYTFMGVAITSA